jgi:benzoate membrane transport protein
VIEAARASGANDLQVISWLTALGIGMGLSCIWFSWRSKMPVVTAWSTPGAALLIGSVDGFTLSDVIGACLVSAVLTFICVSFRPVLKLISRIPHSLSAALLAGILLPICMAFFKDAAAYPEIIGGGILIYLAGLRFFPSALMLVLLLASVIVSLIVFPMPQLSFSFPQLVWQTPSFSIDAAISLAAPLFLVTMLSQNLPGIAIHHAHGYEPDHSNVLKQLCGVQLVLAPFGGFTFNLAAITAAMCMQESVDKDPGQRYIAGIVTGVGYLFMGLAASAIALLFVALPPVVVHTLAGLALLSTFHNALAKAMESESQRLPATFTLLCAASGISIFGLSAPVWGLAIGLVAFYFLIKSRKPDAVID